jgi:hypothetical protein
MNLLPGNLTNRLPNSAPARKKLKQNSLRREQAALEVVRYLVVQLRLHQSLQSHVRLWAVLQNWHLLDARQPGPRGERNSPPKRLQVEVHLQRMLHRWLLRLQKNPLPDDQVPMYPRLPKENRGGGNAKAPVVVLAIVLRAQRLLLQADMHRLARVGVVATIWASVVSVVEAVTLYATNLQPLHPLEADLCLHISAVVRQERRARQIVVMADLALHLPSPRLVIASIGLGCSGRKSRSG